MTNPDYDYKALIKDARFEVEYYTKELAKVEGKLFRTRLALEQLELRHKSNK
jgi:hypothetical protein